MYLYYYYRRVLVYTFKNWSGYAFYNLNKSNLVNQFLSMEEKRNFKDMNQVEKQELVEKIGALLEKHNIPADVKVVQEVVFDL
jgi:hypothetical protein